eukprot:COSAG01_NODE_4125_length_5328_cov_277.766495_1_plen_78_part_10
MSLVGFLGSTSRIVDLRRFELALLPPADRPPSPPCLFSQAPSPMSVLTPEELYNFDTAGWLHLRGVLDAEGLARIAAR